MGPRHGCIIGLLGGCRLFDESVESSVHGRLRSDAIERQGVELVKWHPIFVHRPADVSELAKSVAVLDQDETPRDHNLP